ncbi:Alkaline phosphatase synthesis transcriptional regulatory protein PhoP [Sporomusa ovata DSM 2662]|uniref:Phosphate regulon transcriptional regulatory protein PhoB (SphR) n=1 Tax=Sporomusa ovata TaxID=2378 RepID=A0A0U1KTR7_9FIRM|nr:response regulator transcription factor [Sporomusa ovata]EQB26727.1 alkaline phosphatase synthesis transcriptional regulatory protein PhoP [Sporomusa ovata DSM 2662]CQR70821.1 Phosphate regulon transcriptional regulatory protein PhoB (SphR) [Sporomusa ovata]
MTLANILVVDDETEIIDIIELYLNKAGYQVFRATTGEMAIRLTADKHPDLIVLDIVLPDISGFQVTARLADLGLSDIPVIFLSCRNEEETIVQGLHLGDDYVTKPFSPSELTARVEARLRRKRATVNPSVAAENQQQLCFADLVIDLPAHSVRIRNTEVPLSTTEFKLLCLLVQNRHRVFSSEQLYELVWHTQGLDDVRTVMVHISNLRRKLEIFPDSREYILTVRGAGYRFNHALSES